MTELKIETELNAELPYRVGRSKTGLGLFATAKIKKGTKIVRYFGPLLDSKKKDEDAIENKYLFEITKRWTIDGSVRENVARYINHSCKPNAESDVDLRKKKVIIRSIKRIEPGEEINYDYGTDYFKAYLKPIGCKCDACETKRVKKDEKLKLAKKTERLKQKAKDEKKAGKTGKKPVKTAAVKKKSTPATKASSARKKPAVATKKAGVAGRAKTLPVAKQKAAAKGATARGTKLANAVRGRKLARATGKTARPVSKAA